jgi:hypothetical protein
MAGRIKKKEHENLTETNIKHVIALLNPEEGKPITKKEACNVLKISYNTTRLNKIIADYHEQAEYRAVRKNQNKGKSATNFEIQEACEEYLKGENVSNIAKRLYRSAGFVKALLDKIGVPTRPAGKDERAATSLIPDACVSETFVAGEVAWSSVYHSIVTVGNEITYDYAKCLRGTDYEQKYGSKCYSITVKEVSDNEFGVTGGFSAFSLAYDLGKLEHLKQYGVKL